MSHLTPADVLYIDVRSHTSHTQVNNPKASYERALFNHLIKTQSVFSFTELVSHGRIKWGLSNSEF